MKTRRKTRRPRRVGPIVPAVIGTCWQRCLNLALIASRSIPLGLHISIAFCHAAFAFTPTTNIGAIRVVAVSVDAIRVVAVVAVNVDATRVVAVNVDATRVVAVRFSEMERRSGPGVLSRGEGPVAG